MCSWRVVRENGRRGRRHQLALGILAAWAETRGIPSAPYGTTMALLAYDEAYQNVSA